MALAVLIILAFNADRFICCCIIRMEGFNECEIKNNAKTPSLNILNLNSPAYSILNWMAVLVEHRLFSIKTPVARRAKRYLIDNFGVNVNVYDLITGYRADDSYFDYAGQ